MEQSRKLSIAIVGMGLIGGSLGFALKRLTGYSVIGIDCDSEVLEAVISKGAADKIGVRYLGEADVLVLALSPLGAVEFLEEHAASLKPGTIVTDVCGVKRFVTEKCLPICRSHGLHFVGGHPMAGREQSGFANAESGLFEGAYYILTPVNDTPKTVIKVLEQMACDIGCEGVTITSPEIHDRNIAFTSQLPHVLAGAYVKSPRCPEHKGFSAGSYRDVSRVATVDEGLWSQLFLYNRDNLCNEIDALLDNLKVCREAVAAGDSSGLEDVLREGRERKESVT